MDDSAQQIRLRIFGLILRAFIGVLFATVILVILVTGIAISNNINLPPNSQLSIIPRLEGYYLGHSSWDGVENAAKIDSISPNITLLDSAGRIVLFQGSSKTGAVGKLYPVDGTEITFKLKVGGDEIGTLIFDRQTGPSQLGVVTNILLPVSLISVFLALLAVVIVALLSRRMVTPLAEVIAASRAVTAGKLDARVQVQGTQDLLVLTDSFNQMAATLEHNDRERRDLLADIAHELRTPISGIRGRLEGILDGVYPADPHHISLALKSNYLLERLVEDLRLLTLAEAHQLTFDKKEIDLQIIAAHAVEMFSAEAQEKNIALTLDPATGGFIILADPQRTEQVIGILIDNALRYVPESGRVWMTIESSAGYINLSICDNGPGIPAEDLPHIFNRFWRKDKSRSRKAGGSGLGLAIAKQFIEIQGGAITAENLSGGGLIIKVRFPLL